MKAITGSILFLFLSCNLSDREPQVTELQTMRNNEHIPSFVHDFLREDLPGWRPFSAQEWNNSKSNQLINDTLRKSFILADINCDGKIDFTGILKDSIGNLMLYQIRSINQYYIGSELLPPGAKYKIPDFGLRFLDSKVPYIHEDGTNQDFECGAIESSNFDGCRKTIFYGNKNGFYVTDMSKIACD